MRGYTTLCLERNVPARLVWLLIESACQAPTDCGRMPSGPKASCLLWISLFFSNSLQRYKFLLEWQNKFIAFFQNGSRFGMHYEYSLSKFAYAPNPLPLGAKIQIKNEMAKWFPVFLYWNNNLKLFYMFFLQFDFFSYVHNFQFITFLVILLTI